MQPPTIYKPGKLNYLWNYLGSSLKSFAAALSPYIGGGDVGYKKYVAILTQTGVTAPVATVLENTTGYNFSWARQNAGNYTCGATGFAPDLGKVVVFYSPGNFNAYIALGQYQNFMPGSTYIDLITYDSSFAAMDFDGIVHVEIRVYP